MRASVLCDSRAVASDFEHKIWWTPSQADADDCWPGVAGGIADRFGLDRRPTKHIFSQREINVANTD